MGGYTLLIVGTLIGFILLAVLLLAPVHFFLEREKEASKEWTPEKIAERLQKRRASTNGTNAEDTIEETAENS